MPTEGEEEDEEKKENGRLSIFAGKQKTVDPRSRSDAASDDDQR